MDYLTNLKLIENANVLPFQDFVKEQTKVVRHIQVILDLIKIVDKNEKPQLGYDLYEYLFEQWRVIFFDFNGEINMFYKVVKNKNWSLQIDHPGKWNSYIWEPKFQEIESKCIVLGMH